MKIKRALSFTLLFVILLPILAQDIANNSVKIMQDCGSAVVRLHVISSRLTLNGKEQSESYGSGAFISADGYIITNHHVAGKAVRIFCTLKDKTVVEAVLVGTDPLTDIAVVKLVGEKTDYPYLKFGDSNNVKVGDTVFALGSPLAFSQSITMGIVSNTSLVLPERYSSQLIEDGEGIGDIVSWIAHDALILPGNSGGALVNVDGEIIGINELLVGLSCSIPSNVAKKSAMDIIAHGEVLRTDFGFTLQSVLLAMPNGVLVADVQKGSNAESAGLKSGDIITAIDGKSINIQFAEEMPMLNYELMHMEIGKVVTFDVIRDGTEKLVIDIESIKKKSKKDSEYLNELLGVLFVEDEKKGLTIKSTKASSGLSKVLNIKEFAIVKKIDNQEVVNYEDLETYLDSLDWSKPRQLLFTLASIDKSEIKRMHIITVNAAKEVVNVGALASERKPWIPIKTDNVSKEVMAHLGMNYSGGVEVIEVYTGNNIKETQLLVGDIIIKQNSKDIIERYTKGEIDFSDIYRRNAIGDTLKFTVLRDGSEVDIDVVLDRYPVNPAAVYTNDDFGFTVRDLNIFDKAYNNENILGVYVNSVKSGSWASLAQLKSADIIVDFAGNAVSSTDDLLLRLENMKKEGTTSATLKVYRQEKYHYLSLIIKWDE